MHGTSVRYTIICMAQRIEAVCASIPDTGTQEPPSVQYSLTHHSISEKERRQAGKKKQDKLRERTTVRQIIYVTVIFSSVIVITIVLLYNMKLPNRVLQKTGD